MCSPVTGEIAATTQSRMKSALRCGAGIKEAQLILLEIKSSLKIQGGSTEEVLAGFFFFFLNCGKLYIRFTILTIATIATIHPQTSFSSCKT